MFGVKNGELVLGAGVIIVLMMIIFPLPSILIDLLFAFSISLSLVIIFVSMHILRPVEFSTFPSILLFVTLFRLALNVATTRVILIRGNEGADAAGQLIKAFGEMVVGGNYAVGLVVFTILVVINFVVITKGAGRIAEVAARFVLDAMPGKQMGIDADMNAGMIDEKEARKRRETVAREADFYGAMDGASKFVRGDAIASIIMILINIIGGLVVGMLQHGMDFRSAAQNYTLLTVGEGLISQIPALILSTAAGVVVTRAASEANLGAEVVRQILAHPRALMAAASVVTFFGLMPGLPHFPLLLLGAMIGYVGYAAQQSQQEAAQTEEDTKAVLPPPDKQEGVVPLDLMEVNIGYGLISLVDEAQGGELLKRISAVRKQMALELGFVVPAIHIRDNLMLQHSEYQILIKGGEVARGELLIGHYLAMNPNGADRQLPGIPTKEPCFGLPALWVTESQKDRAHVAGYTVVDLPSVVVTHLTEIIRRHAYELLGRQETQMLLDQFKKDHPKVVEELIPNLLTLGNLVKVLSLLLKERVPIRDFRTILETLADYAPITKDPDQLTEHVRQALSRTLTKQYQSADRSLPAIFVDPHLDQQIAAAIQQTPHGSFLALDPILAQKLLTQIRQAIEKVSARGYIPVFLCSPMIRRHLRRLAERVLPSVVVLSSNEVASEVKLQLLETVKMPDPF